MLHKLVMCFCFTYIVQPISNGTLRLVESNSHGEGKVEVFVNGQWVMVCDDGWDDGEAGVVCRQLGFGSSGILQNFQISGNEDDIVIPNFSCIGNESALLNCSHTEIGMENCDNFDNIGVICTGATPGSYMHNYIAEYIATCSCMHTYNNCMYIILYIAMHVGHICIHTYTYICT